MTPKCCDWSDWVRFVTKTRQDNYVIDSSAAYIENETGLLWLIRQDAVIDEAKQDNKVINHTGVIYTKNESEISWLTGQGVVYDKNGIRQWCDKSYRCGLY